jgi:hypothetical protein
LRFRFTRQPSNLENRLETFARYYALPEQTGNILAHGEDSNSAAQMRRQLLPQQGEKVVGDRD